MSKFSTKLKQKQSIVPQQIIKSRLLELSIDELEKDLETEIQINPVLEERNIEESKSGTHTDPFPDQSSYELFLANIPASIDISDELTSQIDTSDLDDKSKAVAKEIIYNLDKNGFLDIELELIADNHGLDINDIVFTEFQDKFQIFIITSLILLIIDIMMVSQKKTILKKINIS